MDTAIRPSGPATHQKLGVGLATRGRFGGVVFTGGLLAAGGPGREHGGIDGQRGLREPFVLQRRLGIHATLGVVGQQPVEFLCKECCCEV